MLSEKLGVPSICKAEVRNELKAEVVDAMKQFALNLLLLDKFGSESMEAFVNR